MERPDQSLTSKRVVFLLLGYLYANPDAQDTAAGITNWWLRTRGVNIHEAAVEVVLKELVTRGWLKVTESRSGHRIYGLHSALRSELSDSLSPPC